MYHYWEITFYPVAETPQQAAREDFSPYSVISVSFYYDWKWTVRNVHCRVTRLKRNSVSSTGTAMLRPDETNGKPSLTD